MAFDDLAKRMAESHGQSLPNRPPEAFPDADLMMAESLAREKRNRANGDIVFGIILLVVGIAITSFTYDSASQSGGTYIIAYGPIIVGIIKLIRGLARLGS